MFFKNLWNIFDLVSYLVIVIVLSIFYIAEFNEELDYEAEKDDIIGLILIAIRQIIQIVRLVLMIKKSHQTRQIHQNAINEIHFAIEETTEKSNQEQTIEIEQKYSDQIQQFSSNHSVIKSKDNDKIALNNIQNN